MKKKLQVLIGSIFFIGIYTSQLLLGDIQIPTVLLEHGKNFKPTVLDLHFRCATPGGMETHVLLFNKLFADNNIPSVLLTSNNTKFLTNTMYQPENPFGPPCITFSHTDDNAFPTTEEIIECCKKFNITTIVCNWISHVPPSLEVRKHYPVNVVYLHHTMYNFYEDELRYLSKVQGIVTVDPAIAEQLKFLQKKNVLPGPPIISIPPFFDHGKFLDFAPKRSKKEFFSEECNLSFNDDYPIITMVANLYPDYTIKNHPMLFKALEILQNTRKKKFHMILAGGGMGRAHLEGLVKTMRLEHCVHFIGNVRHIPELLYHSTLHVLSSAKEGLNIALLEAALMKKPFLAATKTSVESYIQNGVTGLLFENNNAEDLASKLEILLDSPQLLKTMGEQACTFVQQNFSPQEVFNKWYSFLDYVHRLNNKNR